MPARSPHLRTSSSTLLRCPNKSPIQEREGERVTSGFWMTFLFSLLFYSSVRTCRQVGAPISPFVKDALPSPLEEEEGSLKPPSDNIRTVRTGPLSAAPLANLYLRMTSSPPPFLPQNGLLKGASSERHFFRTTSSGICCGQKRGENFLLPLFHLERECCSKIY